MADQLQTNFASDLRNILKCVFLMNSSQMIEDAESKDQSAATTNQSTLTDNTFSETIETGDNHNRQQESLPEYEEDMEEIVLTHDRSMQIYLLSSLQEICGRISMKYESTHTFNHQYQYIRVLCFASKL